MTTRFNKHQLLYIEDDPGSKRLLTELFEPYKKLKLETAWSAEEGLELARKNQHDMIFIDINLPLNNGIWVMKEIRQSGNNTCKFIALSADSNPDTIKTALDGGFDAYYTKPLELHQILDCVDEFIGLHNEA